MLNPRPFVRQETTALELLVSMANNVSKDSQSTKSDSSPSNQETIANLSTSTTNLLEQSINVNVKHNSTTTTTNAATTTTVMDKKEGRTKKKSSWLNSLMPTYKSRLEEFRKLFEVPVDELLVVDYSCALQREILVQGRLYLSQNHLCFYANIFGWETNLTIKWEDVIAITKDKTALVIPNAVTVSTATETFFFTSFMQRDKTYLMLFRIWQSVLVDQPMTNQDLWRLVHGCYGSELGLTSDDEDYMASIAINNEIMEPPVAIEEKVEPTIDITVNVNNSSELPTDQTDNSESEVDKPISMKNDPVDSIETENIKCIDPHEGKVFMQEEYSVPVDKLFTLLFTSSKFFLDFHAARKTTDVTQTPWTHNPLDNSKSRVVNLTVFLGQTLGPKSCQTTEKQTMLPCSKAGNIYVIEVECTNAGVPYADSFYVLVHYCLKKISNTHSAINAFVQIKYKKNLWGFVKSMVENSVLAGLDDFFAKLKSALHIECELEQERQQRRKSRRSRRLIDRPQPRFSVENIGPCAPRKILLQSDRIISTDNDFYNWMSYNNCCAIIVFVVLLLLLIINLILYFKLWSLEDTTNANIFIGAEISRNPPKTQSEWINLLQQQENLRGIETRKWQKILNSAIGFLRQAEESLNELQRSINAKSPNEEHSEL